MKIANNPYNLEVLLLLATIFTNAIGLGIIQMYSLIYIFSVTNSNFCAALQGVVVFGSGIVASSFYLYDKKYNCDFISKMLVSELWCFGAILMIAGVTTIWLIYISLAIVYIAYGFFKPAYQTMLYRVTNPSAVVQVNAVSTILTNIALALSWLLAPLTFGYLGYRGLFFFAALIHLLSSGYLWLLKNRVGLDSHLNCYLASEVTINYRQHSNKLSVDDQNLLPRIIFLITASVIVKATIDALEMGVFKRLYHLSDLLIGLFFSTWIFGGVIAGAVSNLLTDKNFKSSWLLRSMVLFLLWAAFVFVYSRNKYQGLVAYAICGMLYNFIDIYSSNFIYMRTTQAKHSGNFGLKNLVINGVMLICLPGYGMIADSYSLLLTMAIAVLMGLLLVIGEMLDLNKLNLFHAACRVTKQWGIVKGEKRNSPS
jgi:hypothetical protein